VDYQQVTSYVYCVARKVQWENVGSTTRGIENNVRNVRFLSKRIRCTTKNHEAQVTSIRRFESLCPDFSEFSCTVRVCGPKSRLDPDTTLLIKPETQETSMAMLSLFCKPNVTRRTGFNSPQGQYLVKTQFFFFIDEGNLRQCST
jgi:hypothetical protein